MDHSLKNRFVHRTLNQPFTAHDVINQTYTVEVKVAAQVIDMTEDSIVQAVMNAAREEGVADLYLMDKRFVIEALVEKANRESVWRRQMMPMNNDAISRRAVLEMAYCAIKPTQDCPSIKSVVDVEDIEKLPALDAVPVVRCKSCMKRSTFECPMYSEIDGSDYGLDVIINDRTDDDGYCHCGARMDAKSEEDTNEHQTD